MKMFLKICFVAMCFAVNVQAQELFQKEYGFTSMNSRIQNQFPSTITQTRDSGFVRISVARDLPDVAMGKDVGVIIKTNKRGEVQWSNYLNTLTDTQLEFVYPTSVIQAHDESFYICGRITVDMKLRLFLLKLDEAGNKLWIKTYSALPERSLVFRSLVETADKNILLIGNGALFKMDSSGICLWAKQYDRNFNGIEKVTDTTYVLAGGGLTLIDDKGNVQWAKNNFDHSLIYVHPLKNGGYGFVTSRGAIVSKADRDGNIIWSKLFNYVQLNPAVIEEFDSGDIIVSGTYGTPAEGQYGWVTILDSLGNLRNTKFLTRPAGSIFSGVVTYDNCFVMESAVLKDFKENVSALLKIDSKGNTNCPAKEREMYLTIEDYPIQDSALSITDTLISITASDLPCEFLPVDITATDICAPTSIAEETFKNELLVFPNPALGTCTIILKSEMESADVAILGLNGKVLYRNLFKSVGGRITLDISPLASGVYFVRLNDVFMQKLVIE